MTPARKPASVRQVRERPIANTAAARFARVLRMLPLISDEEWHEVDALAMYFALPRQVVLDDLFAIYERGDDVPAGFIEGVSVFFDGARVQIRAGSFDRPMGLSPDEVGALSLGLSMLRQERPLDEAAGIVEAREALHALAATGRRAKERKQSTVSPPTVPRAASLGVADAKSLALLQRAWAGRVAVQLTYRKPTSDAVDERVLHPYRLVFAPAGWYVIGWDAGRRALRTFRVDRIRGVKLTRAAFEIPADFRLEDVLNDGKVFAKDGVGTLVVKYSPRIARWIGERETGTSDAAGWLHVRYPLADDAWAVRHALQYGPDAVVVEPDRVRVRLREVLERMRR